MTDWLDMGTVTPIFNDWQLFPQPSIGGKTFMVRFNGIANYELYFRTFVVINPVYIINQEVVDGPGKRFYPNRNRSEIITVFDIPPEFEARGLVVRDFAIRKFLRRPYIGRSGEPNYSVTMLDYVHNETPVGISGGGFYE